MKVYRFPNKNVISLVVTGILGGGTTQDILNEGFLNIPKASWKILEISGFVCRLGRFGSVLNRVIHEFFSKQWGKMDDFF